RLAHAHLELRNLYPGDLARWRFAWPIRPLIAGTMGSILRVRAAGRFRSGGVSGRPDGGSRATFAAARLDVVCALHQHQCGNSVLKDELLLIIRLQNYGVLVERPNPARKLYTTQQVDCDLRLVLARGIEERVLNILRRLRFHCRSLLDPEPLEL